MITSLQAMPDQDHPEPDQYSDISATRHLCTGAYEDRSFRDLVIRKVHNDSRRRVAPSYGFDLVPVVRHAWRAWFLDVALHTSVLGCLTLGLTLGHELAVVLVSCVLGTCFLLHAAARNLAEVLRLRADKVAKRWSEKREPRHRGFPHDELDKRMRLLKATLAGCVVLALIPFVVAKAIDGSLHAALPAAVAMAEILVACGVAVGVLRQLLLNAIHRASSLRPESLTRRERVIDEQQHHACVVYHRPEHRKDVDPLDLILSQREAPSPFVGTGKLVNRWLPPMTIQLLRPDPTGHLGWAQREHTTPPFRAHQLVDRLRSALTELSETLPGLAVADRLYVAEADVSTNRRILTGDVTLMLRQVIDNHRTLAHHYLETSVPIAGGELVTTVLIGVSLKGRCLSLDVATCALTRTPQDFQRIDRYAEHGASAVARAALGSVFRLPADALRLWRLAEVPVVLGRAWWAIKDRTHKPRRRIEVGARVAIRERTADDWSNAQLDETTIYDHMKIIEQRILKATEDFLEEHDVDTSVFEKRATSIINSGVLNMGGVTEVNQSAIGMSAQALINSENAASTAQAAKQAAAESRPA